VQTVCLSLMCKNEAEMLRYSLPNIKPYINEYVIVDTGSTDTTKQVIEEELAGIPGQILDRPWVNWGHNRTEAIALAKESGCDFIFIMDADEKLVHMDCDCSMIPEGFEWNLDVDSCYWINIRYGNVVYSRPNLLSAKHSWHYVGVTHEYLTSFPDHPKVVNLACSMITHPSRATKTPEKCAKDAELLEAALIKEPDNSRYWFYAAQSYRDSGNIPKAIKYYEKRSQLGGWEEEVFYSLYQVAKLKELLNDIYSDDDIALAYIKAYEYRPSRGPEALGSLARFLRGKRRFALGTMVAERAKNTPFPNDLLFVDTSYYKWRALDEFAIASYWVGRFEESVHACNELLKRVPEEEKERIINNRQYSVDRLGGASG
jgi:glycosyltransferase involved in cell wall biosynthesis